MRVHSVLVLKEQTHMAASRLAWTVMILNSSETSSGPLSNGRVLTKCTVKAVYIISFGDQKGIRANTSKPPCLPACSNRNGFRNTVSI